MTSWLGAAGIVVVMAGCASSAPDGRTSGGASPGSGGNQATKSASIAEPLVTHQVEAPEARAGFLRKYAEATGLESKTEGGSLKVGPVLSYFEAAWLAGLVPDGKVTRRETFGEPASTAPFMKIKQADGRRPIAVVTRRALGERFALVTWERDEDDTDLELYQTHANGPLLLAKLPKKAGLDMSSGVMFTKVGEEGTVLQVMNERKDGAVKAERLIAWRPTMGSRDVLFDLPFFSLVLGDKADPVATVTRLVPEGTSLRITSYKVTLKKLDAAKEVSLALNDWSAEIWKDKPRPDLVELAKVEKAGEKVSSLE
jgi:hypothetical protein